MDTLQVGKFNLLDNENKEFYIFGIGTNAKIVSEICKWNNRVIKGYIVSDDQDIEIRQYKGIPIYKISQCDEVVKNNTVIVTIREGKVKQKVLHELGEYNFTDVVSAKDYVDWINVLSYFYSKYFLNKGINIQSDILDINGVKLINGFKFDEEGKYSFLIELGDIILPKYFDDYSICNEGPYELEDEGIALKSGDIVLDCGANMGLFSTVALNEGCKVYGFEPAPHTRDYLIKIKNIYPENFSIEPYALSDEDGETEFYVGADINGENSITNLSGSCKDKISVKMKTIDNFVNESGLARVDFIKADIEGAERYMLLGGGKTLKKYAPKLAICTYHLKDDPKVLENIIKNANPNYKIIHKYKKLYAYVE